MSNTATLEPNICSQIAFCSSTLDELRAQPGDAELRRKAASAALAAADLVSALKKNQKASECLRSALDLAALFARSELHEGAPDPECVQQANKLTEGHWPDVIAAMILAPARSLTRIPSIETLPYELWPEYTRYLLAPLQPDAGSAEIAGYKRTVLYAIRTLAELYKINRGSAAVSSAIEVLQNNSDFEILQLSTEDLREIINLRFSLYEKSLNLGASNEQRPITCRSSPIRLGVCLPRLSDSPEVWSLLSLVKHLHPSRIHAEYYVEEYTYGPTEDAVRHTGASIHILDSSCPESTVRAAALDVALISVNPICRIGPMHRLGIARYAPLQVGYNVNSMPTGLPAIDMLISTDGETCDTTAERFGLLPLAGILPSFSLGSYDRASDFPLPDRKSLGFSERAKIIICCAHYRTVSAEMIGIWTKVLSRDPDACLLIHLFNNQQQEEKSLLAMADRIDRRLQLSGISSNRISIFCPAIPSAFDWARFVALGDIYLDSHPISCTMGVAAAIMAKIPVITWSGEEMYQHKGALILAAQGLDEYIVRDVAESIGLTIRLLSNETERNTIKELLNSNIAKRSMTDDSLAASDSFSALVELALNELNDAGYQRFRVAGHPLSTSKQIDYKTSLTNIKQLVQNNLLQEAVAALQVILGASPYNQDARLALAEAATAAGDHTRAAIYYRALSNAFPDNPRILTALGFSCAYASKENEALKHLERSIRLDANQPSAWHYYAKAAIRAGKDELAREILSVLKTIAPDDNRTREIEDLVCAEQQSAN